METYVVRIRCHSPYLTPWRNCTLWGRLSWVVADDRLPGWTIKNWVRCYSEGKPPLIVGDAFPVDAVPVPALFLATASGREKRPKTLQRKAWLKLCSTGEWPAGKRDEARSVAEVERMHVVLNRATGSALLLQDPEKADKMRGQLRTEIGEQPKKGLVLLAMADDRLGESGLKTLINELCTEGWGRGRTYGYGQVSLASVKPIGRPAPTGWVVALGHCHPTEDLPREGYWRWSGVPVRPHDPNTRRGEHEYYTTMLQPGASWAADAASIGQSISWTGRSDYLHCGLAPTWPVAHPGGM